MKDENIDYDALDSGIRGTVRRLYAEGFNTCDSGDGASKLAHGYEADEIIQVPHVAIRCNGRDIAVVADRLMRTLARAGIVVEPLTPDGSGKSIQATYDPADGSAIIMLSGVSDGDWPA